MEYSTLYPLRSTVNPFTFMLTIELYIIGRVYSCNVSLPILLNLDRRIPVILTVVSRSASTMLTLVTYRYSVELATPLP